MRKRKKQEENKGEETREKQRNMTKIPTTEIDTKETIRENQEWAILDIKRKEIKERKQKEAKRKEEEKKRDKRKLE